MTELDPFVARLAAARPAPPPGLRAQAIAAGRAAWTPWWRRLSIWSAVAAAVVALDVAVLEAGSVPATASVPPAAVVALTDDPALDALFARRLAHAPVQAPVAARHSLLITRTCAENPL